MNLHLNKELFREFIDNLNTRTGIDSDIIEKDYYVCTILKELSKNQDELQSYFKGGTAVYKILDTRIKRNPISKRNNSKRTPLIPLFTLQFAIITFVVVASFLPMLMLAILCTPPPPHLAALRYWRILDLGPVSWRQ